MSLLLEIITPEKKLYSGNVDYVVLPSAEGELGILPGHIPLLTLLKPGALLLTKEATSQYIAIDKGFARVIGDRVSVLVEGAIEVKDIDLEVVEKAQKRAEEALLKAREHKEIDPAEIEKLEALLRFSLTQQLIKKKKK